MGERTDLRRGLATAASLSVIAGFLAACSPGPSEPAPVYMRSGPTAAKAPIPSPTRDNTVFTVRKGDTVIAIAHDYHVPLGELIAANKLRSPYLIRPGERLLIPDGGLAVADYTRMLAAAHPAPGQTPTQTAALPPRPAPAAAQLAAATSPLQPPAQTAPLIPPAPAQITPSAPAPVPASTTVATTPQPAPAQVAAAEPKPAATQPVTAQARPGTPSQTLVATSVVLPVAPARPMTSAPQPAAAQPVATQPHPGEASQMQAATSVALPAAPAHVAAGAAQPAAQVAVSAPQPDATHPAAIQPHPIIPPQPVATAPAQPPLPAPTVVAAAPQPSAPTPSKPLTDVTPVDPPAKQLAAIEPLAPPPAVVPSAPAAAPPAAPAAGNGPPSVLAARNPAAALPLPGEATPGIAMQTTSSGRFMWPVHGRVLASYASPGAPHNEGINIAAPVGTPVRTIDAGTVAYVGNEVKGYDNLVLVKHANGLISAYANLDGISVRKGDVVAAGEVIGRIADPRGAGEAQLHFELRRGKKSVDPKEFLDSAGSAAARAKQKAG